MEDLELAPRINLPGSKKSNEDRKMVCPECESQIALDTRTECGECGAHLKLKVEIIAPSV